MGSFKVKLVGYFLLLALVPLAAAFWGFSSIAARSESRRADAGLQSSLRAGLQGYNEELNAAGNEGVRVSGRPGFASALALRDRKQLGRILAAHPRLRVEAEKPRFRLGTAPDLAAERRVSVIGPSGLLGQVIAALPLDERLVRRLESRSGLEEGERLALVRRGRVVAGVPGTIGVASGQTDTVELGGEEYRALVSPPLENARATTLAVLTPQDRIDAASASTERRLLLALLGVLLLVGFVAYLEGRSIVRGIRRLVRAANAISEGDLERRVPVSGRDELATLAQSFNEMAEQLSTRLHELEAERERLEGAIILFGEALAATHDVDQLLRVILDAEVEATGATGGMVIVDGRAAAQIGDHVGPERLEVPLRAGDRSFGRLVLTAPQFTDDARMTAVSLAAHAVVALENARLHRIVEHQAMIDGLTGLANRRHAQEALENEFARAERFGGPVAIVLCDLDSFKDVNDRFGHLAGDDVLRELAAVLQESVRSVDLAARWGGEEFALLLPGTDASGGAQVAERAREALQQRTILSQEGEPIRVTASFGVAAYPQHGRGDDILSAADVALYEAKRRGKNRVETAPAQEPGGDRTGAVA